MKKTTLGKGAKANHLTYLGDAEIGEGANHSPRANVEALPLAVKVAPPRVRPLPRL